MDAMMGVKRGVEGAALPPLRQRRVTAVVERPERRGRVAPGAPTSRPTSPVPTPPFWGDRVVKGIPLADYADLLDEKATFAGRWGLRGVRGGASLRGPRRDRGSAAHAQVARPHADRGLLDAGVVYGYFPCVSEGDDLVV